MTDRSIRADTQAHARRIAPLADDARLAEIRAYAGFLSAIGPDTEGGRLDYLLARVDQLTAERQAAFAVLRDWIGSDWFGSNPTQAILGAFGNPSLDEDDDA